MNARKIAIRFNTRVCGESMAVRRVQPHATRRRFRLQNAIVSALCFLLLAVAGPLAAQVANNTITAE
jgi:hypothetical protein